jgi:putative ABC transport system permease protein
MSPLRRIWNVVRRARLDEELRQEVDTHLALIEEEERAQGSSEERARQQARSRFGSPLAYRERALDAVTATWLEDTRQDGIYALRQLRKNRAFTLAAVVSLALGIGATTAVFSVVYGLLIQPFPYAGSHRMVYLIVRDQAGGDRWVLLTGSQFQQLRLASGIESVTGIDVWNLSTTDEELPADVKAIYFTANAASHFGIPPLLGRNLVNADAPDDQEPTPVVVLAYRFWQRHYGGSTDVVGRRLQLGHKSYTIVGVMPPRFVWADGDVFLPLQVRADRTRSYLPLIKLRPGVSRETANAEFQVLLAAFAKQTPTSYPAAFHVHVLGLNDFFAERWGYPLVLLLCAVALLLAVGCANVSILLLARASTRQQEMAIRTSLGATRTRIVRQLLTEALGLSIVGAIVGVVVADVAVPLIARWLPASSVPSEVTIDVNVPVLLFSVAVMCVATVLFGLAPALRLSRPTRFRWMQSGGGRATSAKSNRLFGALISCQVALTLVLVTGAGHATASFLQLMRMDLGYDPHATLAIGIPLHENTYTKWQDRAQLFDQIRQRIAALPDVVSAGISTNATPPANGSSAAVVILGRPASGSPQVLMNFVSAEYFAVLHIPLLQGRLWSRAEAMQGAGDVIINETFAREQWPGGNAVGQEIRVPDLKADPPYSPAVPNSNNWLQIVGIVGDARNNGLRNPVRPAIYLPYTIKMAMFAEMVVRTRTPPLSIVRAIRREVHLVDPDQQVSDNVRSLDQWITAQPEWGEERLVALLFGIFSGVALALAVFGLYSVVSYTIDRRTNELGIRVALGAGRTDVLRVVLAPAMIAVSGGVAVGVALSLGGNRMMSTWSQSSGHDRAILLGAILFIVVAAAAACVGPARRVASIDPVAALRYE